MRKLLIVWFAVLAFACAQKASEEPAAAGTTDPAPVTDATTAESTCTSGGGAWQEFPNEGEFCHDECNKPEDVRCKRMQSFGCDCGDGKCWDGSACVDG